MWAMIAPFLANLLGGPIVNGLLDGYKAKLAAGNTTDRINAELAQRELAVEQREAELNAQIIVAEEGRWWTAMPRAIVQWSFSIFVAKCVLWDTVLGWGSTPALRGDIASWAGLVMAMWFGGRTVEKVARILKR